MATPTIGSQLGTYRIEALLGRGGMGVVYVVTAGSGFVDDGHDLHVVLNEGGASTS